MQTLTGQLRGDQVVREDAELHGQITGSCLVVAGNTFILHGQVAGDLTVELGARAVVHGMVAGNLRADGAVRVFGTVVGSASGEGLQIQSGSLIDGREQR